MAGTGESPTIAYYVMSGEDTPVVFEDVDDLIKWLQDKASSNNINISRDIEKIKKMMTPDETREILQLEVDITTVNFRPRQQGGRKSRRRRTVRR